MDEFEEHPQKVKLGEWTFQKIRLSDKNMYDEFIKKCSYPTNLWSSNFAYLWGDSKSDHKRVLWRFVDNMLVTFVQYKNRGLHLCLLPFGEGGPRNVLYVVYKSLIFCNKWNEERNADPATVRTINASQLDFLRRYDEFDKYFQYKRISGIERHFGIRNLVALTGKNYRQVRNAMNRFHKKYPQAIIRRYEHGDYEQLLKLNSNWRNVSEKKYSIIFDGIYFPEIIKHYDKLDHLILVIEIDGEIVGTVTGGVLPTGQSWGCLIKKMDHIDGLNEVMIVEFAREINRIDPNVELINVGSDLGTEGLKAFKDKFRPVLNLERYRICMK